MGIFEAAVSSFLCFVYKHSMQVRKNMQVGSSIYKLNVFEVKFAPYVRIVGDGIRHRNCLINGKINVNNMIIYVKWLPNWNIIFHLNLIFKVSSVMGEMNKL